MSGKMSGRKFQREREREGWLRKQREAEAARVRLKGFDPDVTHGDLLVEMAKHRLGEGLRLKG